MDTLNYIKNLLIGGERDGRGWRKVMEVREVGYKYWYLLRNYELNNI